MSKDNTYILTHFQMPLQQMTFENIVAKRVLIIGYFSLLPQFFKLFLIIAVSFIVTVQNFYTCFQICRFMYEGKGG